MDSVKEIKEKIHEMYWEQQGSCANIMLHCLSELMNLKLERQVSACVTGLHGAEKFGAQCGLALAGQMFIGIYYRQMDKEDAGAVSCCAQYAETFSNKFGSLVCSELRRSGYIYSDPRHLCEQLTCDAVIITYNFLKKES